LSYHIEIVSDNRKIILVAGVIILIGVITLTWMGRTAWGPFEGPCLWSGDIHSQSNSQCLLDAYGLTHILHGLGFYLLLWLIGRRLSWKTRLLIAVGLEMGWEILENTDSIINRYREATLSLEYFGDSILNSISDVLAMVAGFLFARKFLWPLSLLLFITIEILLFIWIRDGLILNILLLIYPIEAIKNWQLAK